MWYRRDGVSVPNWPKGQIGTLTPSLLYHTKPRPLVNPTVPLSHFPRPHESLVLHYDEPLKALTIEKKPGGQHE